jgi:hypothetical protein
MELSGCGDECRRTANFYKAVRCFEVFVWPGWCRKNPPISEAPSPVILKSATISYRTPCCRLLTDSTLGFNKPSVPNIVGRWNTRAGMSAYGQVGSATGGQ